MPAELPRSGQRLRLLFSSGPGVLVIVSSLASYLVSRQVHDFGFDKWVLLRFVALGVFLVGAGALFHWKAVADERGSGRPYGKTMAFLTGLVFVLPVVMVLALDQAVGVFLRLNPPLPLLVYPAHYRVSYHTPEFAFTAETNAIGIRDHEVDLQSKDRFRVLALGDSFTYGWGVENIDAWPKVVERLMSGKERVTEVLNLGCPGTSVDAYAAIAEKAIPLLRPDVVVVGVLQGDDIKQLDLGTTTDKLFKLNGVATSTAGGSGLSRVLPHIHEWIGRRPRVITATQIQDEWKATVREMLKRWTPAEQERFDEVDDTVKAMVIDGGLNPWDVYFAIKQPDYMDFTLHPERPEVRKAIDVMASNLKKIKVAAAATGARVQVVSVPAGCYTCVSGLLCRRKAGYRLDDSALHSDAPDEVIRSACEAAGVVFHAFTSRFRETGADRKLYFEFDGHFNPDGHALFAEQVAALLEKEQSSRARSTRPEGDGFSHR
jgi:lysophospholipase L1-like esterase